MSITEQDFQPGAYYHIYNRGTDLKTLFQREADYSYFKKKLQSKSHLCRVVIIAYCLMPNHYHLLVQEPDDSKEVLRTHDSKVSSMIHSLQTSYAMYFNRRNQKSGYVFQGRFYAKCINSMKYFRILCCYIHCNPLDAHIIRRAEDWRHSSARAYLLDAVDPIVCKSIAIDEYALIHQEYVQKRLSKNK